MSQLRAIHEDVISEVLSGEGRRLVLQAPYGVGLGVMVTDLCRRAVASSPQGRALIVVRTRLEAAQTVAMAEADATGAGVAITGENFRYFLEDPEALGSVFVITANLVFRQDVHAALRQVAWSVIVTRETPCDSGSRIGGALLDLSSRFGWLFINPTRVGAGDVAPEHDVIDWYALSRDQLGLHPARRLLVWEYERDPAELAALDRLEALVSDSDRRPSAEFMRRVLVSSATSSPQAFESLLFRAVRRPDADLERTDEASDLDETSRQWRPDPQAVEALIAQLEGLATDSKLAALIAQVREFVETDQRVIVFCRYVATAEYLFEALSEEWPDRTAGRIVSSTGSSERQDALDRWHAQGGVLIAGLGRAGDGDLGGADLAVAYDPVAEHQQFERVWASVDRPGRTAPPTVALLQPSDQSRVAAEEHLLR
jgi:hypothetical protein